MADNLIGRYVKTKLGIIFHTKFKSSQLSLLHMVNVWSILTINRTRLGAFTYVAALELKSHFGWRK